MIALSLNKRGKSVLSVSLIITPSCVSLGLVVFNLLMICPIQRRLCPESLSIVTSAAKGAVKLLLIQRFGPVLMRLSPCGM
jgi:hypothetical protein